MSVVPCRARVRTASIALAVALATICASAAQAAVPQSDTLLPATTKGYVSLAQAEEMQSRWNQTQWGQLLHDEIMRPFVDDLQKQMDDKLGLLAEKLGITRDDLDGVAAGELSLAVIERKDRPAALAITIDVTGRKVMVDKLMAAIEKRFAARKGRKSTVQVDGTTFTVFNIPPADANGAAQETVYFLKDDVLCGIDDRSEATAMLKRFAGAGKDNLQSVAAYAATMERCKKEAQDLAPELRWYAEPFGLIFAARTLRKAPRNSHDKDYAAIFQSQGFASIQGAGGYVNLLVDGGIEILHRTSIYAPPVPGKENDPLRWNLAMRMMQMSNTPWGPPPAWVPRMSASYSTINFEPTTVFDNLGTLVDAINGRKDIWKTTIEGWKSDPYGVHIDVRKEFVENLAGKLTVVTDFTTPITVNSERSLIAIEAKNEKGVFDALVKWMKGENYKRIKIGEVDAWESLPPETNNDELDLLSIQLGGSGAKPKEEKKHEKLLPNSAVCVAHNHLMITSDVDYLKDILAGFPQHERLATSYDFKQVVEVMNKVDPGAYSAWSFVRTDEELRPTYELIRQNKMPQSDTLLGKLLNNLLTTEAERKEGVTRKQRVDGSKLPSFEAVRRFFGPAGRSLRSYPDGWVLSGVFLNTEAE